MKCGAPIKGKKGSSVCKGDLSALRTLANGRSVRRERRCSACGQQVWTIEVYEADLEQARQQGQEKIQHLENELQEANKTIEGIKLAANHFLGLLGHKRV
jgi:transcriptional regulator NrdR family protein